ncbi:hypothetical protein P170DRAFT_432476 [Aspergillus steynii IBT 23096]|uniref:Uncharacterized protein n=1 Tax=Aspergillus steynii IBT 23096 TaxID=1392250 RepID=A0A2I2GQ14_9EURO|nr:uncharacterized protein P170DRAFT_432476 [Aspergillus steynii IBT 23096]PLB54951.1 hypothetical protein P170DRAFT_432476 [Aspergillus steynii IBT 23096]
MTQCDTTFPLLFFLVTPVPVWLLGGMTLLDSARKGVWHSSYFSGARSIGDLISGSSSHPRGFHDLGPEVPRRVGTDAAKTREDPVVFVAHAAFHFILLPRRNLLTPWCSHRRSA